jgi:hypothetical protein
MRKKIIPDPQGGGLWDFINGEGGVLINLFL